MRRSRWTRRSVERARCHRLCPRGTRWALTRVRRGRYAGSDHAPWPIPRGLRPPLADFPARRAAFSVLGWKFVDERSKLWHLPRGARLDRSEIPGAGGLERLLRPARVPALSARRDLNGPDV